MNVDIEQTVKQCSIYLENQCTQPCETALHYDIACKPLEVVGTDVFIVNIKTFCVL